MLNRDVGQCHVEWLVNQATACQLGREPSPSLTAFWPHSPCWTAASPLRQPHHLPSHDHHHARLSLFSSWSYAASAVCNKHSLEALLRISNSRGAWELLHDLSIPINKRDSGDSVMAPVSISRVPSSDQIRQVSRSISTTLSSIPATLHHGDLPEDVYVSIHRNIPFIPRAIQHISNLLSRASGPSSSSIRLPKRQNQILAIPTTYAGLNDGPAPGEVAGIVIGAVGGFLLILWLLYTCFSMGNFGGIGGTEVVEEEIIRRRSRSPRRSRSHSETIEITKSRSPVRRERIVVEETRRVSRPPDPEPAETVDDIVEVIEEHSLSPPPPSRRTSKRTSGYRNVDPAEFGGGGRPMRKVR